MTKEITVYVYNEVAYTREEAMELAVDELFCMSDKDILEKFADYLEYDIISALEGKEDRIFQSFQDWKEDAAFFWVEEHMNPCTLLIEV